MIDTVFYNFGLSDFPVLFQLIEITKQKLRKILHWTWFSEHKYLSESTYFIANLVQEMNL